MAVPLICYMYYFIGVLLKSPSYCGSTTYTLYAIFIRGKRKKALPNRILQPKTPYGYDWDADNQTYLINELEAELIRSIYQQYIDRVGATNIAKKLFAQGIRNRLGNQFSPTMIWRIVSNERYAGVAWQFVTKTTKLSQYKDKKEKRPQEVSVQ